MTFFLYLCASSMISRRLIRIKVFQSLFPYFLNPSESAKSNLPKIAEAFKKTQQAYQAFAYFFVALGDLLELSLQKERSKYFPDQEKIREMGFINVEICHWLKSGIEAEVKQQFPWHQYPESLFKIYEFIKDHQEFKDFNFFDKPTTTQQKEFFIWMISILSSECEDFYNLFEETYPQWCDDEPQVVKAITMLIQSYKEGTEIAFSKVGEEEIKVATRLLNLCVEHHEFFNESIRQVSKNWDPERIALPEVVIMEMALCEFKFFSSIPTKVTINEYLELAKDYSTPMSSKFINGILDTLRKQWENDGTLIKKGKGLIQ